MKKRLLQLIEVIKDVLNVILSCWLSLAMLAFGYYALHVNDQGRDVISSLDAGNFWLIIAINITLLFWAYEAWSIVRLTLLFTDFSSTGNEKRILVLQRIMLVIAAIAPFVIFGTSIARFNQSFSNASLYMVSFLFYLVALYFREAFIKIANRYFSSMVWYKRELKKGDTGLKVKTWQNFLRDKGLYTGEISGEYTEETAQATEKYQQAMNIGSNSSLNKETLQMARKEGFEQQPPALTRQPVAYHNLSPVERVTFWIPVFAVFFISVTIWLFPVSFPQWLTPLVVIFLALGVWTGMLSYVVRLEKHKNIPASFLLILLACLFSLTNNNHTVRTIGSPLVKDSACRIDNHFCQWINTNQAGNGRKKVILVAGQGGGIRAAYWTASLLALMHDSIPGFENYLYGISSVSGSSLGAAAYNAALFDNQCYLRQGRCDMLPRVQRFLSKDYLSPVTAAFVFPDMLQRFWFYPIESFDRARYLEYSWEEGWQASGDNGPATFKGGFVSLWNEKTRYQLPSLFLNGTHAESGHKVITTNLSCSGLESDDITQVIGKDIPLSSAALLSARFPGVTPGALIPDTRGEDWGNVVDGGYYDNSGVVTLLDLYKKLHPCMNEAACNYQKDSIDFLALIIENGVQADDTVPPISFIYETRIIPSAFIKAYDVRPEQEIQELQNAMTCNGDKVIRIRLPRNKSENLPLGWFLSEKARGILNRHVNDFKKGAAMREIVKFINQ